MALFESYLKITSVACEVASLNITTPQMLKGLILDVFSGRIYNWQAMDRGYMQYNGQQLPPAAPPGYTQSVGGVGPSSPFTPQQTRGTGPYIVTTVVPVGPQKTHTICPACNAEINTTTESTPGSNAYIWGTIICLLGGILGCCLIPCFLDQCRDVHHYCPHCSAYLGRYRP